MFKMASKPLVLYTIHNATAVFSQFSFFSVGESIKKQRRLAQYQHFSSRRVNFISSRNKPTLVFLGKVKSFTLFLADEGYDSEALNENDDQLDVFNNMQRHVNVYKRLHFSNFAILSFLFYKF